MPSKNDSLALRVQTSYEKLAVAAKTLNTISDQLGQTVAELDAALKRLNLGLTTWTSFCSGGDVPHWWSDDIGYAKIDGKWGLAIRSISGNYEFPEYDKIIGEWLFNDAPRALRLQAVDKIPDLLEALVKEVADFTEKLSVKLKQSQELTAAISSLANKAHEIKKETRAVPPDPAQDALRQFVNSAVLSAPVPDGAKIPGPPPPTEAGKISRLEVPPAPTLDGSKIPGPPPPTEAGKIGRLEVPPAPTLDGSKIPGALPRARLKK